jgi:hypothetical protein
MKRIDIISLCIAALLLVIFWILKIIPTKPRISAIVILGFFILLTILQIILRRKRNV